MPIDIAIASTIARLTFGALGSIRSGMNQRAMLRSLNQMRADIEKVERKADQLLIGDLLAAFNALGNIAWESTPDSRSSRLAFAEERLLASTSLDQKEILAGKAGSYWLVRAHYGLAYLAHLRNDDATTALHMTHVFVLETRHARQEIFPHFYEAVFGATHEDIDAWYDTEREKLDAKIAEFSQGGAGGRGDSLPWKEIRKVLGPLGLVVLLPPLLLPALLMGIASGSLAMSDPKIRALVTQLTKSKYGTPEQRGKVFRAMKEKELAEEYEEKIDSKVKGLAMELRESLTREGATRSTPQTEG